MRRASSTERSSPSTAAGPHCEDRRMSNTSAISGFNHVLIVTKDMNKSIDFFVNVLGLGVKGTTRRTMNAYPAGAEQREKVDVERLYFLQLPDGAMLVIAEAPRLETPGVEPCLPAYWPKHG